MDTGSPGTTHVIRLRRHWWTRSDPRLELHDDGTLRLVVPRYLPEPVELRREQVRLAPRGVVLQSRARLADGELPVRVVNVASSWSGLEHDLVLLLDPPLPRPATTRGPVPRFAGPPGSSGVLYRPGDLLDGLAVRTREPDAARAALQDWGVAVDDDPSSTLADRAWLDDAAQAASLEAHARGVRRYRWVNWPVVAVLLIALLVIGVTSSPAELRSLAVEQLPVLAGVVIGTVGLRVLQSRRRPGRDDDA